ncbi:MAG: right-handed parallel beta-helix repeat-containing protein [bacterium]
MKRSSDGRVPSLVAVSVAVVWAAAPVAASAAEWSVQPDGSGDFPTIQAAVNGAVSGDEIILEDGLFTGTGNRDVVLLGKDVIVRSRNGPTATTIDSQGQTGDPHRAFKIKDGETSAARIEGLTITGGFVEGLFPESGGGGILVAYGTHPTITNCVFTENEAGFEGFGAGLLAWEDCDITLTDCVFSNNTSGWYGGGFTLRKYCDALVERCTVFGNWSLHAGGGASITRSNAIVNDCLFMDNETFEVDGGGVLVKAEAQPIFTRCVFAGNRAWAGGALGLGNLPNVTVIDCLFENNDAVSRGGAICLDQEPPVLTIWNSTFVNNRAPLFGGHIFQSGAASLTLRNCILGNYCDAPSAIFSSTSVVDIDCCVVIGGSAEVVTSGTSTVLWGADNVDADPMFCGADPLGCDSDPEPTGDWTIDVLSPASPAVSPCGRIGAYDVGCGATSAGASLETRSFGSLKALFRR